MRERERESGGTGILFEEPNPTGSRPRDLIELYRQQKKPHPPNTQGRARREHGGEQGHPEEAESHPEEAERRKRKGTETADQQQVVRRKIWGSAAARPTLTPGLVYGGHQVRDHMPIVSVNPKAG